MSIPTKCGLSVPYKQVELRTANERDIREALDKISRNFQEIESWEGRTRQDPDCTGTTAAQPVRIHFGGMFLAKTTEPGIRLPYGRITKIIFDAGTVGGTAFDYKLHIAGSVVETFSSISATGNEQIVSHTLTPNVDLVEIEISSVGAGWRDGVWSFYGDLRGV